MKYNGKDRISNTFNFLMNKILSNFKGKVIIYTNRNLNWFIL